MARSQGKRLELLRRRLEVLAQKRVMADPLAPVQDKRMLLGHLQKELYHASSLRLAEPRQRVAALAAKLDAMSPLKVLGRGFTIMVGFSMVTDESGAPLRRAQDAAVGSQVTARLASGRLLCRVEETILEEEPS